MPLGSFINDCLDLFNELLGPGLPGGIHPLHHLQRVVQCVELCPLHFEGAGNGPVVITWISREHELYSGASPISFIEHYVTFRDDRRLLSLLGFVHNWPTSRWSATKKRKLVFIKRKWNHVVFSRAIILSFHPVDGSYYSWDLYTTGQLVDGLQQKKKTGFH